MLRVRGAVYSAEIRLTNSLSCPRHALTFHLQCRSELFSVPASTGGGCAVRRVCLRAAVFRLQLHCKGAIGALLSMCSDRERSVSTRRIHLSPQKRVTRILLPVRRCRVQVGGGIAISSPGGRLALDGTVLRLCTAASGGAVYLNGSVSVSFMFSASHWPSYTHSCVSPVVLMALT